MLQIGVSIGVRGRREPGTIVLLSVVDVRVLMAVRPESVSFVDIVVLQLQFQFHAHHPYCSCYLYITARTHIPTR
jgi:hypothetical protein